MVFFPEVRVNSSNDEFVVLKSEMEVLLLLRGYQ